MDAAIATMPRGGPDACWLNRRLQTNTLEYTDRYDIPDEIKQSVIDALDRLGDRNNQHEAFARTAVNSVAGIDAPRILELGSGHGKLSSKILELHPSATVTISDLDPTSVTNIAASALGANPRVHTQTIDATAIDAADNSYDLVVFAQAFHHLPPAIAARAIAEATRVGTRFLVIDLERWHPLSLLLAPLVLGPVAAAVMLVRPRTKALLHDGYISALRSYSRSAFTALGKAADPNMHVDLLGVPAESRRGPKIAALLFSRASTTIGPGR